MRLLFLLLVISACSSRTEKPGICDRRALDGDIDHADSFDVAATLVAEACALPAPLEEALAHIRRSDCTSAARGIAESPELFLRACPAGLSTVSVFREHEPATANAMFSERCDLPRLGFASQAELAGAPDPFCLILGSMLFVALDDAKEPHARRLARMIALRRR